MSLKLKIGKQITISIAKIALGSLGTFMVTAGYLNDGQFQELAGYILGAISLAWSAYDNTQKLKIPVEVAKDPLVKEAVKLSPVDYELPPH